MIFENFFKLNNITFSQNKSALVSCLMCNRIDEDLFKNWIAKEMLLNINDTNVEKRYNFIIEQYNKLSIIEDCKIKEMICNYLSRLISSKFSGKKQAELAISLTLDKLIHCFINKQPIIFIFGFGGYKNYNSPSFPEVDFAELFHMKYMLSYLYPIITSYPYGVRLEYESEEISIQFNNVPQSTTDRYTITFKKLLEYFKKKVFELNNLKIDFDLVIAREMYNPDALYKKMKDYYPDMQKVYLDLSEEEQSVWYKRAKTNFLVNGTANYSNLTEEELKEKVIDARINNECFLAADYDLRIDFWERPNAISLYGTWGKSPCASPTDSGLHLKATAASNTDFWIGTGVFKVKNNDFEEMIYSQSQYEDIKHLISYEDNKDQALKSISKNFNQIPILKD